MKIGWLRIGQPIDIDYMQGSVKALNTGIRVGMWEALIALGHKVVILSYVRNKHVHMLGKDPVAEIYDYSWIHDNVIYDPHYDVDNLDLVFIEYGPGSTLFQHRTTDAKLIDFIGETGDSASVSMYWYLTYLLERYKGGRLVYISSNGNTQMMLRVPLLAEQIEQGDFTVRCDYSLSKNNMRYIMEGVDLSDYLWELWSFTLDAERQRDMLVNQKKNPFGTLLSGYYSTMLGVSDNFDPVMEPCTLHDTDYDLVYVGHQRDKNRTEKLVRFMEPCGSAGLEAVVYGDWDIDNPHIDFRGPTKEQGSTPIYYNKAIASVYVAEKQFEYIGTITPRTPIAIRSGCVMFADDAIHRVEEAVGDYAVVSDGEELSDEIYKLLYDVDHRYELLEHQRSLCVKWVDVFDDILAGEPHVRCNSRI